MATISNSGGGGTEPEEQLIIPSTVRIINTSGFVIPNSILNRAWTALLLQVAERSEEVTRSVDNNFWAYYHDNHIRGNTPASPATVDKMTSFFNMAYNANIDQALIAGVIPNDMWGKCGYEESRVDGSIENKSINELRIWAEVGSICAQTLNPATNNFRASIMRDCLQPTDSRLQTYLPPQLSTLALHLAKPYGPRTSFARG